MMATALVLLTFCGDGASSVSCGAACTYLLVRDANPKVELSKALELLPDRAEGHSFAELAAAARSLGVSTTVANVKSTGRLPKQPFIAHFQTDDADPIGHFVYLRPLEPTCSQYQLIAPPFEPEVLFANEILKRSDFTGWVMTQSKPNFAFWFGAAALLVGASLLALPRSAVPLRRFHEARRHLQAVS